MSIWKFDEEVNPMESREYLDKVVKEFNTFFKKNGLSLNKTSIGIKNNFIRGVDILTDAFFIKVPKLEYKIEIFRIEQALIEEYPIIVFNSITKQSGKCENIEELQKIIENITGSDKVKDIINSLRSRVEYAY
ncbi:hypothetical protein [Fusobacterium polymorphum]|uniref:hypothetical protein n=1 Tax=Fusobacterium nucleatum subsp. polymorphum TaxID=76857 RepID=UPI0022FFCA8D|nr:hypothetical protein [Fusobacterium nucleatum]WCB33044.1 hypothetical protein PGW91_02445 [Fusobacterium nucleatum]